MDLRLLFTVFTAVFIAELGDKTQLATMLFAAERKGHTLTVFAGASLALILATAVGVAAGSFFSRHVSEQAMKVVAGAGFIAIGLWILLRS